MIERIIRSPLSMMFFVLLLGGLIWSKYYSPDGFKLYADFIVIGILIVVVLFYMLIIFHNKKNPGRKIRFAGWIPYEFKEEDEGKQWITFQACRKVYLFYSFAIPFSIILITVVDSFPALPLIILLFMGLSQFGIFWWVERKYYKNDQEDNMK